MLQIGIHDRDQRGARCEHSLDACRCKTSAPDPAYRSHPWVISVKRSGNVRCPVRGIVIHEDYFPRETVEGRGNPLHQWNEIIPLVVGRNHERQLNRLWRLPGRSLRKTAPRAYLRDCRAIVSIVKNHSRTVGLDNPLGQVNKMPCGISALNGAPPCNAISEAAQTSPYQRHTDFRQ